MKLSGFALGTNGRSILHDSHIVLVNSFETKTYQTFSFVNAILKSAIPELTCFLCKIKLGPTSI